MNIIWSHKTLLFYISEHFLIVRLFNLHFVVMKTLPIFYDLPFAESNYIVKFGLAESTYIKLDVITHSFTFWSKHF